MTSDAKRIDARWKRAKMAGALGAGGWSPEAWVADEIAANEEVERLALEGELHLLEVEWREAEALAAISDDLLVPAWVRRRIAEWRRGSGG